MCLFALGFLALVALIGELPSYFLLSTKANSVDASLERFKDNEQFTINEETQKVIKDINAKLKILSQVDSIKTVSDRVPEAIIKMAPSGVKISSILYFSEGTTARGEVRGVAPTRESLLLFQRSIEANKDFSNIVLPISSLLKNKDLEFSISFSVAK